MKSTLFTLAITSLLAAPAFAGPKCEGDAPMQPLWETVKSFEDEGGVVEIAKMTKDGCYEIYGRQAELKLEIYYDPRTGEELEREED